MIGLPPQFQSHKKITYMLEEAKPRMSTDAKIFDQNPFFLNVQNGTLILETRELKPPDPKDYITKQCPVEFNRDATCSDFDDFLNLIMGRKPDMVDYIKVAFGYSLTGITDSHVFFMLYGQTGANGKSTLLTVLKGVMGDYAYHTDIENLLEQRNYIIPAARMEWVGIRLLTTSEVPPNRRLNESLVKDLTGGDEITGRHFYLREWTYRPNLKLWIPGNERPRTTANAGIMRRARSIPFNVKIENPIEGYDRILLREASGILNLGVSGAMRYLDNGFYEPPEVVASTEQFKSDMDTLAPFLEECCIKGNEFEVSHQELYGLYVAWNKVNQNTKPLSGTGFGIRLREQNFEKYRKARWPNGHSGKQINKTFYRGLEINWEAAGQYTGSHEPDMFGGLDEE
jgi:putative DNA primase/helicase